MFNFSNYNYQKFLLSLALIPLIISSLGINKKSIAVSHTIQNNSSEKIIIAQQYTGWIATIFERRPRRRNGARNDVCSISPGLVDTYIVWNEKPLFLWRSMDNKPARESQEAQLIVREYNSQKNIWKQPITISQQKVIYNGTEPLQPGTLYQWLIIQKSGKMTNPVLFKIMPTGEREKIKVDLQAIEQQAKSTRISPEEIVLKKADYFLNYQVKEKTDNKSTNLWSDALTLFYSVENPSYIQEREKLVQYICT